MQDYYKMWTSVEYASSQIYRAVKRFVFLNGGAFDSTDDLQFCLDRDGDPVSELIVQYHTLLEGDIQSANSMLEAVHKLYQSSFLSVNRDWFLLYILGALSISLDSPFMGSGFITGFLRLLRSIRKSYKQRECDLYYSALLYVGEGLSSFSPKRTTEAYNALRAEWDVLIKERSMPPASLARLLCRQDLSQWPAYMSVICEASWPNASRQSASVTEFQSFSRNLSHDAGAALVASELHRLAYFLESNSERGDVLFGTIFGPESVSGYKHTDHEPPYLILNRATSDPVPPLESWRIASRGAVQHRRVFEIKRGNLTDREANKVVQFLMNVVGSIAALMAMAA